MSTSNSTVPQQRQTRKGLAIASLILSIISILGSPILGLGVVGALSSVTLGAIALSKIKKKPTNYGGRKMAIAGIMIGVILLGSAAITLPLVMKGVKLSHSTGAIHSLRAIHQVQAQFNASNSRFATLKELAESGLLDHHYADASAISGYVYSSSEVSDKTYCVHATRVSDAIGAYDFVVCEDGIIRLLDSKTPGRVRRGEGVALGASMSEPSPGVTPKP